MNDFNKLLNKYRNKINDIEYLIDNIQERPELILINLFKNGEKDLLEYILNEEMNINKECDNLPILFQNEIYNILQNFLISEFNEYSYDWNRYIYKDNIKFIDKNGRTIALLDIYKRKFISIIDENIILKENQLKNLNCKINSVTNEINNVGFDMKYLLSQANTPLKMVDIYIRKNKYLNETKKEYQLKNSHLIELQVEYDKVQSELNNIITKNKIIEFKQNKLQEYFKVKYNYSLDFKTNGAI